MLKELSMVAHALSDQTRLRILKLLALRPMCVCELTYVLAASQSRVSQNLAILKYAGLVTDERRGRLVYYSLQREAIEEAISALRELVGNVDLEKIPDMAVEQERWLNLQAYPMVSCPLDETQTVVTKNMSAIEGAS